MPECQIPDCGKPLGADTINMELTVCREHQKCASCNQHVVPAEINYCLDRGITIKHARCLIQSDYSTDGDISAEVTLLNLARLVFSPDTNLALETNEIDATQALDHWIIDQSLEQQYRSKQLLQSLSARLSLLLSKNKVTLKLELDERAKLKMEEVKVFRETKNLTKSDKKKKVKGDSAMNLLMNTLGLTEEQARESLGRAKDFQPKAKTN